MTTRTASVIRTEIDALSKTEHLIQTNSGTFSATEACRKVGTGDPAFATHNVYETVGGTRRETGPDEVDAPGRMRRINDETMADDRAKLKALRAELKLAEKSEGQRDTTKLLPLIHHPPRPHRRGCGLANTRGSTEQ